MLGRSLAATEVRKYACLSNREMSNHRANGMIPAIDDNIYKSFLSSHGKQASHWIISTLFIPTNHHRSRASSAGRP